MGVICGEKNIIMRPDMQVYPNKDDEEDSQSSKDEEDSQNSEDEEDSQNSKKDEAFIEGNAIEIQSEKLNIIMNQKENNICKIIKNGKPLVFYVLLMENIKKEQL